MTDSSESKDQTTKPDSLEPTPELTPPEKAVFMKRAEGQSFEEFKKACIKRFREAGLIK
jgi:hypothetical protein